MSPPVTAVTSDPKLPEEADAVVIGGGIIGAAATYYLAKRGHSVALLEKGRIAAEQSSRNWGWCRQQNRDERELPLVIRSLELWGGLDREIGADLGFRRAGLVYVTRDPAELAKWESWLTMAQQYQVHSRMLSADEARARTPGRQGDWIGGIESPTDGKAEPSMAGPALAAGARALGATVHQGCAARSLETQAGQVSAVITEKGTIRTARVLCAGGAWSSMLCRHLGIDLPQAGVRSTAFATTEAPEVTPGGLSTPEFTMRRRVDGGYTVAIRGRGTLEITPQGLRYARTFLPLFQARRADGVSLRLGRSFIEGPEAFARWSPDQVSPFERIRVLDPAPDPGVVQVGMKALRTAYPAMAGVQPARAWAGWIDHMPDAIPTISAIDKLPGFYLATGFSGHGFGIGPAAGLLAADLVCGDAPTVDPSPFRYARLFDGTMGPVGPI